MCTTCGCGIDHHGAGPHGHVHGHRHDHDDGGHDHDHEGSHAHAPRGEGRRRAVLLERDLLAKNDRIAAENRRTLAAAGVSMFNIIGSPGAGKTALLEATIGRLRRELMLAVLEGDQATDRDAQRIQRAGCRVLQINTDSGCYLDASMIAEGLRIIAPRPSSVLFVENVGNLVCPALFDIGERAKIVVMSVTEGEDKPLKYAHVWGASELFVLTKIDLLPHVVFDEDRCMRWAREVNPDIEVLRLSALRGDGMNQWCNWIRRQLAS
jgi:hydrogenase nickel incorporation protein HypB